MMSYAASSILRCYNVPIIRRVFELSTTARRGGTEERGEGHGAHALHGSTEMNGNWSERGRPRLVARWKQRRFGLAIVMALVAFVGSTLFVQAQQRILKSETVDNTRNMRFCEILVVRLRGIDVYNTTGVSECPAPLWNALNTRSLRRQSYEGASKDYEFSRGTMEEH